MKPLLFLAALVLLAGVGSTGCRGDALLKNGNLQDGISAWHGDGHMAYLAADGTEADDATPNTTPVIKLRLSHDPEAVYQEFETHDSPTSLNIQVDAMASADFKRSPDKSVYTTTWAPGGTWYWTGPPAIPAADFWIRGGPGWFYRLTDLTAGVWTTVKGHFESIQGTDEHSVYFCVPPGTGSVYIKNAVVTP
jgi:hypothetical protein